MRNAVSISSFLLLLLCTLPYASSVEEPGSPPVLGYRVIQCRPHDRRAFTQGLIYHNGFFYESTGLLRRILTQRGSSRHGEGAPGKTTPGSAFR